MADDLDKLFFEEMEAKLKEAREIAVSYKAGMMLLWVPLTHDGVTKRRFVLQAGISREDALRLLDSSYEWARALIENDKRWK